MAGGGQQGNSNSGPPAWEVPYYTYGLDAAKGLQQAGGPQMVQSVAPLNGVQNAGVGSILGAAGGPNASGAAQGWLSNLESGSLLNPASNPFLQSAYQQGLQGIQNSADSQFGAAGRNILASAPIQASEGAQLANALFEPAYGQTLQAMGQGAALAPSVDQGTYMPGQELLQTGAGLQQQAQNVLSAQNNMYNYAQALPYNTLSFYSSMLNGMGSPFQSSQSSQQSLTNPWLTGLGGAASGAALGSAIMPGIGTGVGALAGGLLGAFG